MLSEISDAIGRLGVPASEIRIVDPASDEQVRVSRWLEQAFPIAPWGRIDWEKVDGARRSCWAQVSDASRTINATLRAGFAKPDGIVYVLWTDATKPLLVLPTTALLSDVTPLLEIDWDTWFLDPAGGWCIEVYHEGELCFGRSQH